MTLVVHGAGAFGTALAVSFARERDEVQLLARPPRLAALSERRRNDRDLPGIDFPQSLTVTDTLPMAEALHVLAIPAQALAPYLEGLAQPLQGPAVIAAKGIDRATGQLLSDRVVPHLADTDIAVLSGPGFATELAAGLPTALTIAAASPDRAAALQDALSTDRLRLYASTDRLGVQLGGAMKNVVALACGICAGAGLGESARAALMTRGFAEIVRLGIRLGADPATFQGLSGFGDLALTAASAKSRNFAAGRAIGAGNPLPEGKTIEGLATARAALMLAERHALDLPVVRATVAVLEEELAIDAAMQMLLARPLREE